MRTAILLAGIMAACSVQQAVAQEWTTFVEPRLGTRVQFPKELFSTHEGTAYRGIGEQYRTTDGRSALAVYSLQNLRQETPATYLRRNSRAPQRIIDYARVTRSFFAVSAVDRGTIYYSRCNFSRKSGGTIHCFDLKYPASEKRAWDQIVTRISRSLQPLERD
jgi:hypothetical protein